MTKLPKLGLIYLDHVWRFFTPSNFRGWPDNIEIVTYHWRNDKERFIQSVLAKKIDILIGNIPATAYETFREIAAALPHVRFVPSLNTQFANKSKENVTLFCEEHALPVPKTTIFYDEQQGFDYLAQCTYPKIIKRSYGPSNYGGYFVHKVDSATEALDLFRAKRYLPMYIQDCIPLTADIRVMLIGHQPVCAFWRVAGKDQWITNTSQGGHMSYSGVPQAALDLAVNASRAAHAEFWACDIAESNGNYYILECATAFAAFPYIRDWIGQYLLWDFAPERFQKPFIPLYHWEELGKMSASVLRKVRHLAFNEHDDPSADGELYYHDGYEQFPMERTTAMPSIPQADYAQIPQRLALAADELAGQHRHSIVPNVTIDKNLESSCPTTMISAEEGIPVQTAPPPTMNVIASDTASAALEITVTEPVNPPPALTVTLKTVAPPVTDMAPNPNGTADKVNLNQASLSLLQSIDGLGHKRAQAIMAYRQQQGLFTQVEDLLCVNGIGKKLFAKIAHFTCVS